MAVVEAGAAPGLFYVVPVSKDNFQRTGHREVHLPSAPKYRINSVSASMYNSKIYYIICSGNLM